MAVKVIYGILTYVDIPSDTIIGPEDLSGCVCSQVRIPSKTKDGFVNLTLHIAKVDLNLDILLKELNSNYAITPVAAKEVCVGDSQILSGKCIADIKAGILDVATKTPAKDIPIDVTKK